MTTPESAPEDVDAVGPLILASQKAYCGEPDDKGDADDGWQPIETAPRDGRELLMTDGLSVRVCYPKIFPRPLNYQTDLSISMPGDIWEYFRDDVYAPGHTWSLLPTHWRALPAPPSSKS
jgi:hypothetical protein